ncbi:MAG: hypothetical protein KAY24_04605 [Candidatus Eisenbacteria sp.]|nr:hypothetical protein [Candidatus Eisenbacteria bacterium]
MPDSIRQRIEREEFDYQALLGALADYARPRDKITNLLRKGLIIRVKKGIYVFGEAYRRQPVSREVLANLIYGPSYISLEYALQYHGLIPERVEAVTSVTSGRSRRFSTPLGQFSYRSIPMSALQVGMDRVEIDRNRAFLIAIPEKALADQVRSDRGAAIRSRKAMRHYLQDFLRIEPAALQGLDPTKLSLYAERYRSPRVRILADVVRDLRKGGR